MLRDYTVVSPSLGGVLTDESLQYDGISRPVAVLRVLDAPGGARETPKYDEQKVIEQYFYDLYGVFMKRLSQFVLVSEASESDTVKLQAMLQEMIKVKKLMSR